MHNAGSGGKNMNTEIKRILEDVRDGRLTVDDA